VERLCGMRRERADHEPVTAAPGSWTDCRAVTAEGFDDAAAGATSRGYQWLGLFTARTTALGKYEGRLYDTSGCSR